jgi:hypothetical protein
LGISQERLFVPYYCRYTRKTFGAPLITKPPVQLGNQRYNAKSISIHCADKNTLSRRANLFIAIVVLFGAAIGLPTAKAVNIIANGSFETPTVPVGSSRNTAQLLIDERDEPLGSALVAFAPGLENLSYIRGHKEVTRLGDRSPSTLPAENKKEFSLAMSVLGPASHVT